MLLLVNWTLLASRLAYPHFAKVPILTAKALPVVLACPAVQAFVCINPAATGASGGGVCANWLDVRDEAQGVSCEREGRVLHPSGAVQRAQQLQ